MGSGNEKKVSDRGVVAKEKLAALPPAIGARLCGIANDKSVESIPIFNRAPAERVFSFADAYITVGRDRPAGLLSGHGGRGATGAHSIDTVVGRASASPLIKKAREQYYVEPDFTRDAARIHVSQYTDVDKNFGLTKHAEGSGNKENCSAIGLKGDAIRIVAREGIKIVSGKDSVNSQNARVMQLTGIDLIAYGQDKKSQPLVKGDNLLEALNSLTEQIDSLAGIVMDLLSYQTGLNMALQSHTHPVTPAGPTPQIALPNPTVVAAGLKTLTNHAQYTALNTQTLRTSLILLKQKYFNDMASDRYISSRHHTVT